MKKVLITGTGLIGKALAEHLDKNGYRVNFLSTTKSYYGKFPCFHWNVEKGIIDTNAFTDVDYIIHLAGAGIADKKWTHARKQELISSRVDSAELIFRELAQSETKVKAFISASGSNYYGAITSHDEFSEASPAGKDFISELCVDWENAAKKFESLNIRPVMMRTGIVISSRGGALAKLGRLVKLCLGSAVGSGKQAMPWIHIEDLCRMYQFVLENEACRGPYNAVSTEKVCNRYFMRSLTQVLHRPFIPIPVPSFMLKALYGEMALILLKGTQLSNDKIRNSGFNFNHPKLKDALEDVYQRKI